MHVGQIVAGKIGPVHIKGMPDGQADVQPVKIFP